MYMYGAHNWVASVFRVSGAFFAFVLLSACSTGAQREGERMKEQSLATREVSKACFDEIRENPKHAGLKTKLYYADNFDAPLSYLTNSARPSKKDLSDLFALHADVQVCRKQLIEGQSKVHPLVAATQLEGFTAADKLWVEFASGKMSWGEFNTKRKDVGIEVQRQMMAAGQKIDGQLVDNHRYEIEQRQRAAEALSQMAAQQQAINALNRPRNTNCTGYGNTVNCTTY